MRRLAHRLLSPAGLALLAGTVLWVWAAQALWASTATEPLHLSDTEPSRYFSASFLERSASYERFLDIIGVLAQATLLVVLAVYAWRGHRLMRESAAGRIGTGMLLGMLGFAVVWLASVPFGLVTLWWQRRHDVSHQGYLGWAIESFFSLGGKFLFVSFALVVAMGLAGVLRRWWWVAAAPIFVGLALLYTFVSPYLIPNTAPLRDPQLLADARAFERSEGVGRTKVRVQEVRRFTTTPNAMATGFGSTRTVVLWGTLLGSRFTRSEIRAVMAHEFAHLANDDSLERVGWLALFLIPASAVIARVTRRRGGLARPEAIPLALFVLVAMQLLAAPLFNEVARRQEAAADWSALGATGEPAVYRAAMRQLAVTGMTAPDRSGLSHLLHAQHPTIMERIAMTHAWEERQLKSDGSRKG